MMKNQGHLERVINNKVANINAIYEALCRIFLTKEK